MVTHSFFNALIFKLEMTLYTKAAVLQVFSRDLCRFQRPVSEIVQDESYFHTNCKKSFAPFYAHSLTNEWWSFLEALPYV